MQEKDMNSGFNAIFVTIEKLIEYGVPFGVIIADNKLHSFVVTRENWRKVDNLVQGDHYNTSDAKALISWSDDFERTCRELNWIKIGCIETQMTGQEWYSRFCTEMTKLVEDMDIPYSNCMDAAREAAGISHDVS